MQPDYLTVRKKDYRNISVSVIVPCYNYAKYLEECIASIANQTFNDYEIVVVNDGSTDNFQEVAGRLSLKFNGIRIKIINQKNSGQPAIARNNGISSALGEFILCLDADDKISSNFLTKSMRLFNVHPKISIVYPNLQEFGDRYNYTDYGELNQDTLIIANTLPIASIFRKKAWVDAGGFKTNVPGYEDWDFWISCQESGHKAMNVKDVIFYYRIHGKSLLNYTKRVDQERKAQLILNHPNLYDKYQKTWAQLMLNKDPNVTKHKTIPGFMPIFN